MNVKESHVVAGMSRDSSVSRQNPNLVYDAHNIRITTRDGKNSLYEVTNEKGTRRVTTSGSQIVGVPIGHAIIDKYIVLFTHDKYAVSNSDHIYRCEVVEFGTIDVSIVFEGDANFDTKFPIETLPVFETDGIQKVYWVDGRNQPRVINIIDGCPSQTIGGVTFYIADALNFSRKLSLTHTFSVTKKAVGGMFPVGTIQYCFSYYNKFGQESCIVDISPMYYLSPTEKGLDATSICHASFSLRIQNPDKAFEYIRVYSIVRTTANGAPQCRVVGDFSMSGVDVGGGITIVDKGIGGRTIDATSLYFIGGEKLIARTLAQKDNTLFLGGITIARPNIGNLEINGEKIHVLAKANPSAPTTPLASISTLEIGYESDKNTNYSPSTANKYYNYSINNNRSSYFIRRFKYNETYRLGFIAQYENGQWSEPIWLKDHVNNITPVMSTSKYATGGFSASLNSDLITALKNAGYKRVAPVVVYPNQFARNAIVQGIVCPTVYNYNDRQNNTPYAQSSWFFRFTNMNFFGIGENYVNHFSIYPAASKYGEIQTMFGESDNSYAGNNSKVSAASAIDNASYQNFYFIDTNIITLHSPDIECSTSPEAFDFNSTKLSLVGRAVVGDKVTDHFITTENVGINVEESQVISISRRNADYHCAPLYGDSVVNNIENNEVSGIRDSGDSSVLVGWITYPWHRNGSLNNQKPLTTKQKSNGFTTRTAMLKRNLTANAYFTHTTFVSEMTQFTNISTPKLFNSNQLAGVKLSDNNNAYIYYGNIDKVLAPSTKKNFYYIYHGWVQASDAATTYQMKKLSEDAVKNPATDPNTQKWIVPIKTDATTIIAGKDYVKGSDPVSMKYKSTPHLAIKLNPAEGIGIALEDATNTKLLYVAELQRTGGISIIDKFGGTDDESFINNAWLRCGNSVQLEDNNTILTYLQGDCYFQMYDCLKTYPFTNEDTNSVIELLSVALETYVNLDFRYDSNRGGGNNTYINVENFNLFNHLGYEQDNNFFTYHGLDYDVVQTNIFSNVVTWSLEKKMGEDVDTWASIDVTNTVELDGAFGKVNKLVNYNNDIYCFQDVGISQLLFNSRVQIPTSDNTPIEITNGMKMQGKKYISSKIGCTNKWSIIETPLGLYFNDDILKATYLFNGQLTDLSTAKGMKSWMNESCRNIEWNPEDFENCRTFYDKVSRDIYWVYGSTADYPDGIALVYSEVLGQYMSFMDYGKIPLIESVENSTYAITSTYASKTTEKVRIPFRGSGGAMPVDSTMTFSLDSDYTKTIYLEVEWRTGSNPRNPQPAGSVFTQEYEAYDKVFVTIYTCAYYTANLYTLGEVISDIQNDLPTYLTVELDTPGAAASQLAYRDSGKYDYVNTYLTNRVSPPFWEIGKGSYNMFFEQHKPYWLTLISNSYPTENKIFNNVAWRDIVTNENTPEPFHTFDHIRVWTENQDTRSVRFSNSLSENPSRQPISYDAAISNLRKKFNVWRCQIPRDKIATNTARARISNPWCYIKLSREDVQTERHEIMDIEVDYFM